MTCYVMLEFTAKKGFGPDLLTGLRAALPTTRSKDGCLSLELTINQDRFGQHDYRDALADAKALRDVSGLERRDGRR